MSVAKKSIVSAIVICTISLRCTAAFAERTGEFAAPSPNQPPQARRGDPVRHDVDFSVVVTPPYQCKVLRVWLPLPQTEFGQEVGESKFTVRPMAVEPTIHSESKFGNRFAYFEFHEPRGAQIIRHKFQATICNVHWDVEPETVSPASQWPESFDAYLEPLPISNQQQFNAVLAGIRSRETDNGLFEAMRWIDDALSYDHARGSLSADADHAFRTRRGHCSDYHGLCATMGRSLGYPTRVAYGLALYPKNSPSHCKLEAHLPPYGWVSFDLSETQKLVRTIAADESLSDQRKQQLIAAARRRLHRGFRENSWLKLTHGTGYELAPKAARPVSVVRTAYVEADGQSLPEPDPANVDKREFAWMTVHEYHADREFKLPFKDISSLE